MMNFLILAVMMITLMGAASYGLVASMRSLQTSIQTLVIQDRLEEATQGILSNIVSVANSTAQIYYVPAPDNLSTPGVPSWITTNAQTPRGVKFLYCPFSNATGAGGSTITTPNSSYTVNTGTTYAGANITSTNYVIQSSARPTNAATALAVIVAPGANQSAVLSTQDCLSVSATGTLPGAIVRIITEQEVQSRAQVVASTGTEFYPANAASGDGKALTGSDYGTFNNVMDYVNKFRPQRVTLDLKSNDSITANAANMDQSSVAAREFNSTHNHSIYFKGANGGNPSFVTGVAGTFSPVFLGSTLYYFTTAAAVNGQLYRPIANSFGNIIIAGSNNAGFYQAENLGRIIVSQSTQMLGASATSATGNENYYTERGGFFRLPASAWFYGPTSTNINNTLFYSEFGGTTIVDGFLNFTNGNNGTASIFYVGGDSTLIFTGSGRYGFSSTPHNETSEIYIDTAGRDFESGLIAGYYNLEAYNQGGLYVISGASGYAGQSLPVATATVPYLWSAGPGSTFGITALPTITTLRPTIATFSTNATTTQSRVLSFIGGNIVNHNNATVPTIYGTNSGTTQCMADTAAYNIASGAKNTNGTTLAPNGNIGMEAAIMLNRTSTVCR